MEAQKKELSENGTLKIYNPLTKAELHVSNSIWNIAHQVFYLLFNQISIRCSLYSEIIYYKIILIHRNIFEFTALCYITLPSVIKV